MNIYVPGGLEKVDSVDPMYLMSTNISHHIASSHRAAILLKKTESRTLEMLSFLKIESVMEGEAGDE